jgi:hypothetical protein
MTIRDKLKRSSVDIIYLTKEHRSTRNVHSKSRGACRPSLVIHGYELMCESGLERDTAQAIAISNDVVDLCEQPPGVVWIDDSGNERRHTFDLLATLRSGVRIAFAVKPKNVAVQIGFERELRQIARQTPQNFAHAVRLITDEHLPLALVHNATLVRRALRTPNAEHDLLIKNVLADNPGVTIGQVVELSGLGGAGFQAVVRAIARGIARVSASIRVDYAARLQLINSGEN